VQEEFNKNYKGKVKAAATLDEGSGEQLEGDAGQPGPSGHRKRRKVSAASFFADSDLEESEEEPDATKDELKEYLALPQIKHKLKSLCTRARASSRSTTGGCSCAAGSTGSSSPTSR